jgi:hypothetical protein
MIAGQKVVCVNDTFCAAVRRLWRQLPVKGEVYHIRDMMPGRCVETGGYEILVTLVEIVNPLDPRPTPDGVSPGEMGFRADRFVPLEEATQAQEQTMEQLLPV